MTVVSTHYWCTDTSIVYVCGIWVIVVAIIAQLVFPNIVRSFIKQYFVCALLCNTGKKNCILSNVQTVIYNHQQAVCLIKREKLSRSLLEKPRANYTITCAIFIQLTACALFVLSIILSLCLLLSTHIPI